MFCREHVAQLRPRVEEIRGAGAQLYAVGNGTANFVEGFRETTGFDGPVLLDPSLAAYRRLGFKRSKLWLLNPRNAVDGGRALAGGHRQGATQGDAWQLGGVAVIRPPGTMVYHHVSSRPGDLAPVEDVLAAL